MAFICFQVFPFSALCELGPHCAPPEPWPLHICVTTALTAPKGHILVVTEPRNAQIKKQRKDKIFVNETLFHHNQTWYKSVVYLVCLVTIPYYFLQTMLFSIYETEYAIEQIRTELYMLTKGILDGYTDKLKCVFISFSKTSRWLVDFGTWIRVESVRHNKL